MVEKAARGPSPLRLEWAIVTRLGQWAHTMLMSDADQRLHAELYPDVVTAGSLSAALNRTFSEIGSTLTSSPHWGESDSYASVELGARVANVSTAMYERTFTLDIWMEEIEFGNGSTPDLIDVAKAIRLWLEDRDKKATDVVREISFLELRPKAESYERGTYIEDTWQEFLTEPFDREHNDIFHWDELNELIALAAARPELRRLLPFTTHERFSVTRRTRPPDSLPVIQALGEGQYALTTYFGEEVLLHGSASAVLDALIEHAMEPRN